MLTVLSLCTVWSGPTSVSVSIQLCTCAQAAVTIFCRYVQSDLPWRHHSVALSALRRLRRVKVPLCQRQRSKCREPAEPCCERRGTAAELHAQESAHTQLAQRWPRTGAPPAATRARARAHRAAGIGAAAVARAAPADGAREPVLRDARRGRAGGQCERARGGAAGMPALRCARCACARRGSTAAACGSWGRR
jgi:hypothetical protein